MEEPGKGAGWILFAGTMVAIAGILNVIYGIAAIDNSTFFTDNAKYVISSLNTWGWVVLIVGVVQLIAAVSIWGGGEFGRWIGIIGASLNMILMLIWLPGAPFLSLAIFGIDILVIYGLLAYGGRQTA
ncbi:MAG: hypothetical protein U0R52_05315 [Solirubrobacterales bacterium]